MGPSELVEQRAALARHRLQALRCLPNWRAGSMPDVEAASSHTVDGYVQEAYWASFDGSPNKVRDSCLACLERELLVTAAAMQRAEQDVQQMQKVLKTLRTAPQ